MCLIRTLRDLLGVKSFWAGQKTGAHNQTALSMATIAPYQFQWRWQLWKLEINCSIMTDHFWSSPSHVVGESDSKITLKPWSDNNSTTPWFWNCGRNCLPGHFQSLNTLDQQKPAQNPWIQLFWIATPLGHAWFLHVLISVPPLSR